MLEKNRQRIRALRGGELSKVGHGKIGPSCRFKNTGAGKEALQPGTGAQLP